MVLVLKYEYSIKNEILRRTDENLTLLQVFKIFWGPAVVLIRSAIGSYTFSSKFLFNNQSFHFNFYEYKRNTAHNILNTTSHIYVSRK